jgi:hypothetical protein
MGEIILFWYLLCHGGMCEVVPFAVTREAAAIVAARAGARARLAIAADPAVQEALERLVAGELDPLALVRFLERHTADA